MWLRTLFTDSTWDSNMPKHKFGLFKISSPGGKAQMNNLFYIMPWHMDHKYTIYKVISFIFYKKTYNLNNKKKNNLSKSASQKRTSQPLTVHTRMCAYASFIHYVFMTLVWLQFNFRYNCFIQWFFVSPDTKAFHFIRVIVAINVFQF